MFWFGGGGTGAGGGGGGGGKFPELIKEKFAMNDGGTKSANFICWSFRDFAELVSSQAVQFEILFCKRSVVDW